MPAPTHWIIKLIASLLLAFVLVNLITMVFEFLPPSFLQTIDEQLFELIFSGLYITGVVAAIVFTFNWHRKEKKQQINYSVRLSRITGVIRYWLSFEIITYGFAKVFRTQFSESVIRDHVLLKDATGFELTWFYFAFSQPLTLIIACLQIAGSIFLLYRRTTLLGITLLLPVMINILLINLFYDIAVGALMNSVMFTLALVFLLSFYWQSIKQVLLSNLPTLAPSGNAVLRNVLRFLIVVGSAGLLFYLSQSRNGNKTLDGVWKITQQVRNGDTLNSLQWHQDTLLWNRIYFDYGSSIALNSNPYYFDKKRGFRGSYQYDSKKQLLQAAVWRRNKQDTLTLQLTKLHDTAYVAVGVFKHDSIRFHMHKQR